MHTINEALAIEALKLKHEVEARRVLSNSETARYLNVSESWLNRRRCYGGGPPHLRLGRRVAYLKTDLDAFLEAQRHRSTATASRIAA